MPIRHAPRIRVGLVLLLWLLAIPWGLMMPAAPVAADSVLSLAGSVSPSSAQAGAKVTYTVDVSDASATDASGGALCFTMPYGFSYVSGSAQIYRNDVLISTANPSVSGQKLTWSSLTVPGARTTSHYGINTFVQDGCTTSLVTKQLDWAHTLMGDGAYVKQLFYGITADSTGAASCWQTFVNGCYDRNMTPVIRLQGPYGGSNWTKPTATSSGNYSAVAAGFARVVSDLPRRDGFKLYVEIWNEPNLNLEWGGSANAVEYAQFFTQTAAAIHALGDDRIVVLNGALSPGGQIDPLDFISSMSTVSGALDAFDVWSAHPYSGNRPPETNDHDGTATTYTNLTIDSYLRELQRLADLGRTDVKVLLTEAGYMLGADNFSFDGLATINESNRADYMSRAYSDYWSAWPEIIGVCPYELSDPYGNWTSWDWISPSGSAHTQYTSVKALDKTPTQADGRLTISFQATVASTAATYYSAVTLSSSNLGSASLASTAPVQVTSSTTPTPTPSPTPVLTPTPTPTVPATCCSVISNGSFETDDAWEIPSTGYSAGYSSDQVYSGSRSMRVGIIGEDPIYSYSSARQSFTVPESATAMRIGFWYYTVSEDTSHNAQYVWLLDEDKNYLQTLLWTSSNNQAWQYQETVVYGCAGETYWLHLGVRNDSAATGAAGMYVDGVTVRACGAGLTDNPGWPVAASLPLILKNGAASETTAQAEALASASPTPEISVLAVDNSVPDRPAGITAMPVIVASTDDDPVSVLELDSSRRRIIAVAENRLLAMDAITGRTLYGVTLPETPSDVAVEPGSGQTFAALPDSGQIAVFDSGGGEMAMIGDLGRPSSLAAADGRLYVTDVAQQRIVMLDSSSYSIISTQEFPAAPHGLILDTARNRLYAGLMGEGRIVALDADSLAVAAEATLGGLGFPLDMALDTANSRLYVAHELAPKYGAVSLIDTADMSVQLTRWGDLSETLLGADSVSVDDSAGIVYLGVADGVLQLDPTTLDTEGSETFARSESNGILAVDSVASTLYVGGEQGRLWTWNEASP